MQNKLSIVFIKELYNVHRIIAAVTLFHILSVDMQNTTMSDFAAVYQTKLGC